MTLPKAIICEIDGVLADDSNRRHFVDRDYLEGCNHWEGRSLEEMPCPDCRPKFSNWKVDLDTYHAAAAEDKCNEWCHQILTNLPHIYLLFVTSRPEKYWQETIYWLDRNDLPTDEKFMKLFMRPDISNTGKILGTNEPDIRHPIEVKHEIFEREIRDKYDVLFALEKDQECCDMWRELGVQVLREM